MLEFALQHPVATAFISIFGFWSIESVVRKFFETIDLIISKIGGDK